MDLNVVVVRGVLARPARQTELPSGDRLVSLEVTVRREGGPAEPVPVVWADPPAWMAGLEVGSEVVVWGRVRRRFFRVAGLTQSRTEVVAARVVRATSRSQVQAVMTRVVAGLRELEA